MGNYTIFLGGASKILGEAGKQEISNNICYENSLDLKPSSEQIFSKNCRWVPLVNSYFERLLKVFDIVHWQDFMGKQEEFIIINLTSEFEANIEFRKIIMLLKPLPGKLKHGFWILQEPCRGLMIVLPNWFIVLDLVRKYGLTKITTLSVILFSRPMEVSIEKFVYAFGPC